MSGPNSRFQQGAMLRIRYLETLSQFSDRNDLRRHGRAGILAWPDAFDPTCGSRS